MTKPPISGPQILFGRYRITATMAPATYGTVYLGYDLVREAAVTITTLKKPKSAATKSKLTYSPQKISGDAGQSTKLSHPNILDVLDYLEDEEQYYVISDYTEYTPLNKTPTALSRGGLPVILTVFVNILHVIQYMNKSGIFGCALRPYNVFVSSTGDIKVDNSLTARMRLVATYPDVGKRAAEILTSGLRAFGDTDANKLLDMVFIGEILQTLACFVRPNAMEKNDQVATATARIAAMIQSLDNANPFRVYSNLDAVAEEVVQLAELVQCEDDEKKGVRFQADTNKRLLSAGDVLFREGDAPNFEAFLLERGTVQIIKTGPDGKELYLDISKPGDIIGEMALIDNQPRMASARAIEPCSLAVITGAQFKTLMESSNPIARKVIQVLVKRLRYQAGEIARLKSLLGVSK